MSAKDEMNALTALDRFEIMELGNRIETAYDREDVEMFLGCFAEDGVIDQGEYGVAEGHEALREWFWDALRVFYDKRHLVTNQIVSGDGERAELFYYFTVVERGQGPFVWGTSTFTDQLVKQNGRWVVVRARRELDPNNMVGPGKYLFGGPYEPKSSDLSDGHAAGRAANGAERA